MALGGRPIAVLPEFPGPVIGTFPSIYQLIPHSSQRDLVFADDGSPVDLYHIEAWDQYGWGILDPKHDELLTNLMPGVDSPEERRAEARKFLAMALARAEQLHRSLDIPSRPPEGTSLHLFASDTLDTLGHGTLDRVTGKIVDTYDEPGDGVVTRRSALQDLREDPHPRERLAQPTYWRSVHFTGGNHLQMTGTAEAGNSILYLLYQAPL